MWHVCRDYFFFRDRESRSIFKLWSWLAVEVGCRLVYRSLMLRGTADKCSQSGSNFGHDAVGSDFLPLQLREVGCRLVYRFFMLRGTADKCSQSGSNFGHDAVGSDFLPLQLRWQTVF